MQIIEEIVHTRHPYQIHRVEVKFMLSVVNRQSSKLTGYVKRSLSSEIKFDLNDYLQNASMIRKLYNESRDARTYLVELEEVVANEVSIKDEIKLKYEKATVDLKNESNVNKRLSQENEQLKISLRVRDKQLERMLRGEHQLQMKAALLERNLAENRRSSFLQFLVSIIATILLGFGVNIVTIAPDNWVAWVLIVLSVIFGIISFTFIQREKMINADQRLKNATEESKKKKIYKKFQVLKDRLREAASFEDIADIYYEQGRYEEAEPLLRQALAIYEEYLERNHLPIAKCLNNLAMVYRVQERYAEAELLLKRVLCICEEQQENGRSAVASSLNKLATTYLEQGEYEKAELFLRRVLEICEEQREGGHSAVTSSLNNLASLYQQQGRYEEAEPLLRQAFTIYKERLGEKHPDTQDARENYMNLLHMMGRDRDTEKLEEGLE